MGGFDNVNTAFSAFEATEEGLRLADHLGNLILCQTHFETGDSQTTANLLVGIALAFRQKRHEAKLLVRPSICKR